MTLEEQIVEAENEVVYRDKAKTYGAAPHKSLHPKESNRAAENPRSEKGRRITRRPLPMPALQRAPDEQGRL